MRRSNRSTLILVLSSFSFLIALPSDAGEHRFPRLDSPDELANVHSYRAMGMDPDGPRPLVLWRWDGQRFIRLATTRSSTSGRFDFGEQALPSNDVYFHVSVRNEAANTNRLLHIDRPVPAPVAVSAGPGSDEIVLFLAHRNGEIRIYDADSNQLMLRRPTAARTPYRVFVDLDTELPRPWPSALSIEQILDDGRRSERLHWPLD